MGINITVEDELGNEIVALSDPTNILHRILPLADDKKFKYLNNIDWYGDTVFNRLQAPVVRNEIASLNIDSETEEGRFIEKLYLLIDSIEAEPLLYLKFYGD